VTITFDRSLTYGNWSFGVPANGTVTTGITLASLSIPSTSPIGFAYNSLSVNPDMVISTPGSTLELPDQFQLILAGMDTNRPSFVEFSYSISGNKNLEGFGGASETSNGTVTVSRVSAVFHFPPPFPCSAPRLRD
jgi:hypothetical protein